MGGDREESRYNRCHKFDSDQIRPTLMGTKNLYENGLNPFFLFGTKNISEGHLMHTVLVCYVFDKLGQACLCG